MNFVDRILIPAMVRKRPMTNHDIYRAVKAYAYYNRVRLTPHWKATVRNTLQRHAKGNPKCKGHPVFIHIKHGAWRLR